MRLERLRWLSPGAGLLGWLLLLGTGAAAALCGVLVAVAALFSPDLRSGLGVSVLDGRPWLAAAVVAGLLAAGAVAGFYGLRGVVRFSRATAAGTAAEARRAARLGRGPRVVALGGGTGLASLLSGLKHETSNLTAVVTVADDGGSSGLLRRDMGVLPPGDIRNCLVALADDESLMSRLFRFRFPDGGLQGHSFGNLFVAALSEVTGDFELAVQESSHVLKVRGRVLPATLEDVVLEAELQGGATVMGESTITASERLPLRVWLTPQSPAALPQAVAALEGAQLVVLGPGSVYTSVIPNLLIPGVRDALRRTHARVVYVCNVMTQPGETDRYTAADHLEALYRHGAAGLVDYVVVNDTPVSGGLAASYEATGAEPVRVDDERLEALGVRIVHARVAAAGDYFRHDPASLAAVLMRLAR